MTRPVLHLARHHDPELEGELIEARSRLVLAKSAWTALAVSVLKREAGAGERVAGCLAELQSAQDALDVLHRSAPEEDE